MNENIYTLAGTVHIPEESKDEFNKKVLTMLYRCGIRKTETINVNGIDLDVVAPLKTNKKGIVVFDYSIFEKQKRGISSFNTLTGELKIADRGYGEYGLVINMLMALQQAYSDMPCFLMREGKPCSVDFYAELLAAVLNEETHFNNGNDIWENMLFFHESPEYDDITSLNAWYMSPYKQYSKVLLAVSLDNKKIELTENAAQMTKSDIAGAKYGLQLEYLYRMLMKCCDDSDFEAWFRELLDEPLSVRKEKAKQEDDKGIIAELSLYIYSQGMAMQYALARNENFWTVWERLGINGYNDIIMEDALSDEYEKTPYPFYLAIQKESEDEFLDLWDGNNLKLSEKLKKQILQWKQCLDTISPSQNFDFEKELTDAILEMENDWNCRFIDKSFVTDFLEHKDDENYQRLLMLLRQYLDKDVSLFPELTKQQAKRWVISHYRDKYDSKLMSCYTTLMTNMEQRKRIFSI